MKKAILIFLLAINITPAHADDFQLVNEDGSIENTLVCSMEICGNPNSLFSVLTLKPGQKYVRNDVNPVIQKETQPYEVVSKVNDDNSYTIANVEPIQVAENVRVLKTTERTFDPVTSILTQPENAPVVKVAVEVEKKAEGKALEVIDELEQWWAFLLAALAELFAGWVWE
jgi:hypothetical protein